MDKQPPYYNPVGPKKGEIRQRYPQVDGPKESGMKVFIENCMHPMKIYAFPVGFFS
jgi:hypothetical protein